MDETKNIPESLSPRLKKNTAAAYTLLALLWVGLGLGVQPLWALCLSYFSTAGISFLNGMQAANATNTNYYYWNYCTVYNSTQSAYVTPASQLNPGATGYTLQQQTVVLKQNWICSYNNRTDIYYSINCSWQSNITAFWAAEAPEPTCSLTANPSTITAGQSTTLTASCTESPTSYSWTGTGFSSSFSSGSVSPTTTTTYSVAGINGTGMGTAASVTVTVNPAKPTCTLTANPATISLGDSSTLTASCSGSPSSYTWTNASFSSSATGGSVSPTTTTTYSVAGTNTSGTGTAANATVTVNTLQDATSVTRVNASPLALNRATGKYGGTITVTNTGGTTITGPLYVFFTLPTGVTLPSLPTYGGLPYLRLDLTGGLAPGATSASAVVTFTDPTNARIAYTTTRSAISF